jgi:hypothetical protein
MRMRMLRGWFHSQNGDRTWGVCYRKAAFSCAFLWAKGLSAKDIHKEVFHVYDGKCLSRKAVHNWVEKFSQGRSKVADDARLDAEVAETTIKRLLCCGFRRTGKAMGQMYHCWWRVCRDINVFSRFEYRMCGVLRPFVTYLLTLPPKSRHWERCEVTHKMNKIDRTVPFHSLKVTV